MALKMEVSFDDDGLPTAVVDGMELSVEKTEEGNEYVDDGMEGYFRKTYDGFEVKGPGVTEGPIKNENSALASWVTSLRSLAAASGEWEAPEGFYEE